MDHSAINVKPAPYNCV